MANTTTLGKTILGQLTALERVDTGIISVEKIGKATVRISDNFYFLSLAGEPRIPVRLRLGKHSGGVGARDRVELKIQLRKQQNQCDDSHEPVNNSRLLSLSRNQNRNKFERKLYRVIFGNLPPDITSKDIITLCSVIKDFSGVRKLYDGAFTVDCSTRNDALKLQTEYDGQRLDGQKIHVRTLE